MKAPGSYHLHACMWHPKLSWPGLAYTLDCMRFIHRVMQEALEAKQAMEEADANLIGGVALHGYRSPVAASTAGSPRGEHYSLLESGEATSSTKL